MTNRIKLIAFAGALTLGTLAGVFLSTFIAQGNHSNTIGWVWGGTTDNTMGSAGPDSTAGFGWASVSSHSYPCTSPAPTDCYGITIPASGAITGYLWFPNVGWVDFQPAGPFPLAPQTGVTRTGNNVSGWARILAIANENPLNTGGYLGWIKMRGTAQNGQPYGVTIVPGALTGGFDSHLDGYAWSDEFGFIYFGGQSNNPPFPELGDPTTPPPPPPPPPPACGASFPQCNGTCPVGQSCQVNAGTCACVTPSVTVSCTGDPASGRQITWSAQAIGGVPPYTFSWNFANGNGSPSSGAGSPITVTYPANGSKQATVVVRDSNGAGDFGSCNATAVQIKLIEDIPKFF